MSVAAAYVLCKHQLPLSNDSNAIHNGDKLKSVSCCLEDKTTRGPNQQCQKGSPTPGAVLACQFPGK